VADDDVELGGAARVDTLLAPDGQRAIAVREPDAAGAPVARDREAVDEAGIGRIAVGVRQRRERQARLPVTRELGCERTRGGADRSRDAGPRVAPLDHEVVLHPHDREAIEPALAHQRAQVRDVARREAARDLEHHAPLRQFQVEHPGRVGPPPVGRWRRSQDRGQRRRRRLLRRRCGRRRVRGCGPGRGRHRCQQHGHEREPDAAAAQRPLQRAPAPSQPRRTRLPHGSAAASCMSTKRHLPAPRRAHRIVHRRVSARVPPA
jgi:hypothetical protein